MNTLTSMPAVISHRTGYQVLKRGLDGVLSASALVCLLPLAVVAVVKRKSTKGAASQPVTFWGQHGETWSLPSFAQSTGTHSSVFERAALACGWVMAVLTGRLSLVGPRPIPADELPGTGPDWVARASVRPGLFCSWWLRQRSNIDYGTEIDADLEYVAKASLVHDVSILARVLVALVYGKPASVCAAGHSIGGIRLLNLSMGDLMNAVAEALWQRQRTRISFVNPDCVNIAANNATYRNSLLDCDWVCADGIGMKIAGNLLGRPVRQNLNGTDLFPVLCAALSDSGHSIYLLGAAPGVAVKAADWIAQRYPNLRIAGTQDGYFTAAEQPSVIEAIRHSQADVLLVAMGAARQEPWLQQHLEATGATIGIGVGGLFDFYSGRIPRAPVWLREAGGEWIYRLIQEPGRMWRRYLVGNFTFLWRIAMEKIGGMPYRGQKS